MDITEASKIKIYQIQTHLRDSYRIFYKLNYYQRKFEIKLSLI